MSYYILSVYFETACRHNTSCLGRANTTITRMLVDMRLDMSLKMLSIVAFDLNFVKDVWWHDIGMIWYVSTEYTLDSFDIFTLIFFVRRNYRTLFKFFCLVSEKCMLLNLFHYGLYNFLFDGQDSFVNINCRTLNSSLFKFSRFVSHVKGLDLIVVVC